MIKITKPSLDDYRELVILINLSDQKYFEIYTQQEAEDFFISKETIDSLKEQAQKQTQLCIKKHNQSLAFISFRLKNNQTVWISSLFTHPEHQKKGYGKRLIQEVEQYAKKWSAKVIVLEVEPKAKWAVDFYTKCNYKILNTRDLSSYPFNQVINKEPVPNRYIMRKII